MSIHTSSPFDSQGYNTQTGENCDFYNQGDEVCDKGAIIMGKNPFGRNWALTKIEYDVFFEEVAFTHI